MDKKLKIGVIGNGNISGVHLRAYSLNPNVEIYALCDINEKAMQRRAKEYGVTRLFTDVNEMVKLPELDAVSVCTWNAAHAECAIAALNAGKHVLCEKPMAMNADEARRMQEAAEKNGETAEKTPKEAKKPAAKKKTVKKTLPWMTKTTNRFKKLKDEAVQELTAKQQEQYAKALAKYEAEKAAEKAKKAAEKKAAAKKPAARKKTTAKENPDE